MGSAKRAPAAPAAGNITVVTGPGTVSVAGEVSVVSCLTPQQIYDKAAAVGAYKTQLPWWKIVLLGAVAHPDPAIRAAIAEALGDSADEVADERIPRALAALAGDPDERVSGAARSRSGPT